MQLAYNINAAAVKNLAHLVKVLDRYLIHISTDFVFDGSKQTPYIEQDKPNPINVYGETKFQAERFIRRSKRRFAIIRTQWTYGLHGDNFVTKLIQRAKTQKSLKVVDDQIGSPTATTEVAKVICTLLNKQPRGIFHFAADGYTSRFQMAEFIFKKLNIPVELSPCKSEDFPSAAARPLNSCFDCSKIKKLLGLSIEPWQLPLERFLSKL